MNILSKNRRAVRARVDRVHLAEFRSITSDALSLVDPSPKDLKLALEWRNRVVDFVNQLAATGKISYKDIPK